MYGRCKKCGRKLTDPESRLRGYGPECWEELLARVRAMAAEDDSGPIPGQISIFDVLNHAESEEK